MNWTPSARLDALEARAKILAQIRSYFAENGVLEVETPVLSGSGNSDPGIRQWQTSAPRTWLRTSPEYAMKRLLAAGSGDIYELGRVFRADESGRNHNREFTLLEWYRVGWSYHALMDEVGQLLHRCLPGRKLVEQRFSYGELFQRHAGLDPFHAGETELADRLASAGIDFPEGSRAEYLDLLISLVIQPQFEKDAVTFVYDFPPEQAALARIRPGEPAVAERFEVFLGPVELANGYQELTDPDEQAERFMRENRTRTQLGQPRVPIDENLLGALRHGLPECSGVALGVDRLLMYAAGAESLDQVIAFFADRA